MRISKAKATGLALSVILFIVIMLMPISGLTREAQTGLAITVLAGVFWIFQVLPYAYTGLMALILFVALKTTDFTTAFSGFREASIWMIIFSFLLAKGFEKSGLGKRVGLLLLNMFKKLSFSKLIITFLILLIIGNLFVPSVAAYVVVLIGLLQGVLAALGLPTDKRTNLSAGLACFFGVLGLINGKNLVSGVIGNSVLTVMMSGTYGVDISYMQWLATWAVMIPLPLVATFFFVKKVYKPDIDFDDENLYANLKQQLKELGPIRGKELITGILFLAVLVLWISGLGGFGVQLATGIIAFLMCVPGIGVIEYEDFGKIQYPMFIFIGSTVSLGNVLTALSIDEWLANLLMGLDVFNSGNYFAIAATFFLIIVLTHIFMESLAQISFFTPVMMQMGVLPAEKVAIIMSAGTHVYQFPFQAAPIAVSLGFGIVDGKDIGRYGVFITLVCVVQTLIGLALGWPSVPGF